jgi:hypothetical protein
MEILIPVYIQDLLFKFTTINIVLLQKGVHFEGLDVHISVTKAVIIFIISSSCNYLKNGKE